ncbi:twin-arginine translocase TatA/TatE family subunit [uncultured Maricaulis sp.]|uniref:twin-arginine translocase TatA/TatE family subunit n=1 Tax=uncultured Maricaulis sp. TaxID=174710 RepID=UPI0030D80DFB
MAPGMWQILLVVLLAVLLFGGRGKIAAVMGDFAKGITSFRKGLKDEDDEGEGESDDAAAPAPGLDAAAREDEKTGV